MSEYKRKDQMKDFWFLFINAKKIVEKYEHEISEEALESHHFIHDLIDQRLKHNIGWDEDLRITLHLMLDAVQTRIRKLRVLLDYQRETA